jgi:hypothetical protein
VHCLVIYVAVFCVKHVFCRMLGLCVHCLFPYVIVIKEKTRILQDVGAMCALFDSICYSY